MSTTSTSAIQQYIQKLGIDPLAAKLYVLMLEKEDPSVLQLSKLLGISRTQVENRLLLLKNAGLTTSERRQAGIHYRALPFNAVGALVAIKEAEVQILRSQFGSISKSVQMLAGNARRNSDSRHYRGIDGLKQVNWHLCNAEKEYRVFEMTRIPQLFGPTFASHCRKRMVERKLISYNLTNHSTIPAAELEPLDPRITNYRHVDRGTFAIKFEIFLFDGLVTLVDNRPEVLEAIEIKNVPFYTMMRQIYDTMWKLGKPLKMSNPSLLSN